MIEQTSAKLWISAAEYQAAFARVFGDATVTAGPDCISLHWIDSPLGPLLAGASAQALLVLEFTQPGGIEAQLRRIQCRFSAAARGANALTASLQAQLSEYFNAQRREFALPLEYQGTQFQKSVWSVLRSIPYGTTCSYLDVAMRLGDPQATRAVGMANGMNPLAIVIPCHRVVNAGGALGGYGGGAWRKQWLLDLERGQGRLI